MESTIELRYPDGTTRSVSAGTQGKDLLDGLPSKVRKKAIAVQVDDTLLDLLTPIRSGGTFRVVMRTDPEGLDVLRHTAAHVMAAAVQELWPGTQVTIGPTIRDGFYYDFDRERPFSEEEFGAIEEAMQRQIDANLPMERTEIPVDEAIALFRSRGEHYKVELIEDLARDQGVDTVSLYRENLDALKMNRALENVWELISVCNKYIVANQPWTLAKDPAKRNRLGTILFSVAETLRVISVLLGPIIPNGTAAILAQLGVKKALADHRLADLNWGQLEVGSQRSDKKLRIAD